MSELLPDDEDASMPAKASVTTLDDDAVDKRNKLLVEIWKQAVDTQKHFNDMCVKSRQLGLTFVAASLGAALYLFIRGPGGPSEATGGTGAAIYAYSFSVCGRQIMLHISLAILLAAAAAVYAVRKLDLEVYHKMLRGAVYFGEDLEERHIKPLLGLHLGMTQSISHFSRHSDARVQRGEDGRFIYAGEDRHNAGEKLNSFYNLIFGLLFLLALAIFCANNLMKAVS